MSERKHIASAPWIARLAVTFMALVSILPIAWARALGGCLGTLFAWLPGRQRAVTQLNLKLCFPDMPDAERHRLVRRSLQETGKILVECASVWRLPVAKLERLEEAVVGEDLLHRALARGKGVMLLAPHLGNWEFLNHYLMRQAPFVCLYRPPRVAELDAVLRGARERTGATLAPATPAGFRPVLRALHAGRLVMVLPDQEPLGSHGVHAPFFGIPALTMTLVARLLRRTGCEVLYVVAERRPAGRFRIRFLDAPAGLGDDDEVRAATQLNRGIEACVELCPEQYLWSYKRFSTAPPGEPTPYRAIWSRRRLRKNPRPPTGAAEPGA